MPRTEEPRQQFLLATYAALPASPGQTDGLVEFTRRACEHKLVGGIEAPFGTRLSNAELAAMADHLTPAQDLVVTLLPLTVAELAARSGYGLASALGAGRRSALEHLEEALDVVRATGRRGAVLVPSAPGPGASTARAADALSASLDEAARWDWGDVGLWIEHCDALVDWHPPAKGYLALDVELEVLHRLRRHAPVNTGMCINWARSAIEAREPSAPAEHLARAGSESLLASVIFSGCASSSTDYGQPWADAHLPPAPSADFPLGVEASLLTADEIRRCAEATRGQIAVGLKLCPPPGSTTNDAMSFVECGLGLLELAWHAEASTS